MIRGQLSRQATQASACPLGDSRLQGSGQIQTQLMSSLWLEEKEMAQEKSGCLRSEHISLEKEFPPFPGLFSKAEEVV